MTESFLNGRVVLHPGDCLDVLARLEECSIDSVVCDPPYHLTSIVKRFGADGAAPAKVGKTGAYARASAGFMGKQWDGGDIAFQPATWAAVWRVLKPGGHLVAFSGTRTYHRMVCAIEDAGFEVRDQLAWAFGSGFPKSHDVSKGIDRAAGAEREVVGLSQHKSGISNKHGNVNGTTTWDRVAAHVPLTAPATDAAREWAGWGTALKPAWEPIVLARKPLSEPTIAANVLRWGTGALNIDGCRIAHDEPEKRTQRSVGKFAGVAYAKDDYSINMDSGTLASPHVNGRWPANLAHDGSEEVLAAFPESVARPAQAIIDGGVSGSGKKGQSAVYGAGREYIARTGYDDNETSAARFFYTAKADAHDRIGSKHPTVKPVDLLQWLVRLVTPRGGTVLDCFAGTGTTGEAAFREGMHAVLIERELEYQADVRRRMALVMAGPDERERESIKAAGKLEAHDSLPLFGGAA